MRHLVAIPSRSRIAELLTLVEGLRLYGHGDIVVHDNGYPVDESGQLSGLANVVDARGWKFYRMWNDALRIAKDEQFDAVVLLNDDIELHSESIDVALDVLSGDDSIGVVGLNYRRRLEDGVDRGAGFRQTKGTYKDGGIWGCAFIVRTSCMDTVPYIDERYNLWYGDDELFKSMNKCGYKTGIAVGAPVLHEGSATTNMFPELIALTDEDRKLFESKRF